MRDRLLRDSAWILGIVCAIYAALSVRARGVGVDAHAYWLAWRGPMYTTAPGTPDAYLYSPAFAQMIWPLAQLPWPFFVSVFTVAIAVGLAWLLKPMGWKWGLPLWLAGLPEIVSGNIFILMAVVAVVGFARPESWAFVALTKISPTVGPVWFLVRGEWRNLSRFLLGMAVITGLSVALAPSLWQEWAQFLLNHLSDSTGAIGSPFMPPAIVRIPLGLALLVWAARKNKRWCIPVSMLLCTPVFWLGSLTLLAAIPRMRSAQGESRRVQAVPHPNELP
ncbi:glycosyltransferase family 87 protein [Pseudarthrobacter sp. NPDC092439]|uniref:glycosyltransferase family 87 protein n=1 Tax=unclassified Pseudarthrobacter TaxID=2647000 RepID=UPI0038096CA2